MSSYNLDTTATYYLDEGGQEIFAVKDGGVVGRIPWAIDKQAVTMGLILVAAHERRKGIGLTLISKCRERFPREEGYELLTTPAMTPAGLASVWAEGKDDRRETFVDGAGQGVATGFTTPDVTALLSDAQERFDAAMDADRLVEV